MKAQCLVQFTAIVGLTVASIISASSQQMPGSGPVPDWVKAEEQIRQEQQRTGRVPNFIPPPGRSKGATSICNSAILKQAIVQAFEANGGTYDYGYDQASAARSFDNGLRNLGVDDTADARSLKQAYGQLSPLEKLGNFEICTTPMYLRETIRASVFYQGDHVSGMIQASRVGGHDFFRASFGGLTTQRYEQLVAAMTAVGRHPVQYVNGTGRTACDQAAIRQAAAQAVTDKFALVGVPMSKDILRRFNTLTLDQSDLAQAVKRAALRADPTIAEVVMCYAPDPQIPNFLQTMVIRGTGGRQGGAVFNFGMPGAVATFGHQF